MERIADENSHAEYHSPVQSITQPVQIVPILCPYYMVAVPADYALGNAEGCGCEGAQVDTRGPSGGRPQEVPQSKQRTADVSADQHVEFKLWVKKTMALCKSPVVPSDYAAYEDPEDHGPRAGQAPTRHLSGRPREVSWRQEEQKYESKYSSESTYEGTEHESLSDVDSRPDVNGASEPQKKERMPPIATTTLAPRNVFGTSHAVNFPSKPPGFFAPGNGSGTPLNVEPITAEIDRDSFWAMSMNKDGCRIVQDAIDGGSPAYRQKLVENLRGKVHRAYQSPHANYVLQKIIQVMPSEHYSFLLEELEGQVHFVVRHRFGCRILQRILEHCTLGQIEPMLSKVLCDAAELIRHQYGNFVLQHVLQHGSPAQRHLIAEVIQPDIFRLAKHRLASHVVSCALVHCSPEDTQRLVCTMRDDSKQLAQLSRREFGSFVVREVNRAARIQGV